ncbi:phage tail terminator protein [Sphingomonas sp. SRS2]|uniref:phage tail terminator protein n=1 Tax=Sphingomonas sp. SRS2 TaxID=133190 RepID=UPI0006184857|nr:hypothetical protein [Sphingomonas sp. SRS2]KKC27440.1 hypothetical protein WP12_03430 [Sphingomonas sp. SRS2]
MKAGPIKDRLKPLDFRQIGGEVEWAGLRQAPPVGQLPAGFIVFEQEVAGGNQLDTGISQDVPVDFMVAIILDAQGRRPDKIDDALTELRDAVRDHIIGWTHPEANRPTLYRGGRLLSVDGQTIAWGVRFRTGYHLRRV